MNVETAVRLAEDVDGWLSDDEARILFQLAKAVTGKGCIVEIGSWKGKSTICLAAGSLAGSKPTVNAIDPHVGSPEHQLNGRVWTFDTFQENIARAGVSDVVRPVVATSAEAASDFFDPVELLFVDGAHELEMVRMDLDLLKRLV